MAVLTRTFEGLGEVLHLSLVPYSVYALQRTTNLLNLPRHASSCVPLTFDTKGETILSSSGIAALPRGA